MRYPPGYDFADLKTGQDWSAWTGKGAGFQGAVEMCNNNGACRKLAGGAMCPSYRVTRDERDATRGRANTLRLALSGRLGQDALFSDEMAETMKLCVGCKACKRECPTGVDMARMKTEVLYQRGQKLGFGLRARLIAEMPRYARMAVVLRGLIALRNRVPMLAALGERITGLARARSLPLFRGDFFKDSEVKRVRSSTKAGKVILFTDTFNRWMEPDIPRAALRVLERAGYEVITAQAPGRPLCCGRTYLAAGMIDKARAEAQRTLDALLPHIRAGVPVVGLEPSCLLTLRDEFLTLLPGEDARLLSENAFLFEEFIAREARAGRLDLPLGTLGHTAHVHGHCHQKAAGVMGDMGQALALIPGLDPRTIESSCCGMAGAFGYQAETIEVSLKMGELSLLPAVRAAAPDDLLIANGTSCRHQIADGTDRRALHIAEIFDRASGNAVREGRNDG
jgi:Fe-S oxidoreductase